MENWYLPITIVPAIGLLILSTSNLMISLSSEIDYLIKEHLKSESIITRKLIQLKTLNRVMVLFYIAVACLATSGLMGGLQIDSIKNLPTYCSVLGLIIMLLGLLSLIKYSYRAVSIRQDQFKDSLK